MFAKNALNKDEVLDQGIDPLRTGAVGTFFGTQSGASGYTTSRATAEREVGVSIRYAFGSR